MFKLFERLVIATETIARELALIREAYQRCVHTAETEARNGPRRLAEVFEQVQAAMQGGRKNG